MSIHPAWLDSIHDPATYPHPVSEIQLLETHISWVILTGDWAYKLKKPVDFGFVDFTTLELRRSACHEEVRLNRRTAPALYDSVVPLAMDVDGPQFGGSGPVIEYAVRMKQFSQDDLLERRLARGELTVEVLEQLADEVAELHLHAAVASLETPYGEPGLVREAVEACLNVLKNAPLRESTRHKLKFVDAWIEAEHLRLRETFRSRKQQGWVRECHGDLHLGNLVLYRGKPTLFDCLEFNPQLRWIDVFSDIAFLVMDLCDRHAVPMAWRVLNEWLAQTGDYEGLQVLKFNLAYRALVRAKVAALRLDQCESSSHEQSRQYEFLESYVDLVTELIQPNPATIIVMHGVSGSGKSFIAGQMGSLLPAIQVRSDVERKRIAGLWPQSKPSSTAKADLYSSELTQKTYQHLRSLTRIIVEAGYSVIVDAAFLRRSDRLEFRALAAELNIPCVTVSCCAPESILKHRISQRKATGQDASDADVAVLQGQLNCFEALDCSETGAAVVVDTSTVDIPLILKALQKQVQVDD